MGGQTDKRTENKNYLALDILCMPGYETIFGSAYTNSLAGNADNPC